MDYGLKPLGREKLWLWLMLVPTIIGLVFGTIGSLFATLGLSLFDWDLINPPKWVGTENYVALFQNKDYIEAFVNTLKFSALVCAWGCDHFTFACSLAQPKNSRRGNFPNGLFPSDGDIRCCHCPGVEYDLWQGDGHSQFYAGNFGLCTDLLVVHRQCHDVGGDRQYLGRDRRRHDHLFGGTDSHSARLLRSRLTGWRK